MNRRVKLTFPQEKIKEPLIFTMGKTFDVIPNIRRARVTEVIGEVVLEITGEEKNVDQGIQWLKDKGIEVELAEGDVLE